MTPQWIMVTEQPGALKHGLVLALPDKALSAMLLTTKNLQLFQTPARPVAAHPRVLALALGTFNWKEAWKAKEWLVEVREFEATSA
jgi:hypothetical protein